GLRGGRGGPGAVPGAARRRPAWHVGVRRGGAVVADGRHRPRQEQLRGDPMEKLIITVAGDSRTSYPHTPLCPPQEDIKGVAQQYIDAVNDGAPMAPIHGRPRLEEP